MTVSIARTLFMALVLIATSGNSALALEPVELRGVLEESRAEMKMPGLRAAVRFPDGRVIVAAVGLADRKNKTPLDNSVGMPGGSTGKTFVAALTLLLVEDELISLDDPASKWLGDREWFGELPNADDILVRHLLSHSSGIGDYPGRVGFNSKMVWRVLRHGSAYFTPEELIAFTLGEKPEFPAGDGFAYSDAGYLVLGRLIEAATGRPYYELLRERILDPLALDQIRPQDQSVLPGITPSYTGGGSNLKKDGRMKLDPRSEWTGGGLVLNPRMLVEFVAALAEGRVVEPGSFERMMQGGWRNPDDIGWHYGFGMFVDDSMESFGHAGRWAGYRTRVRHHLVSGVTIAVQSNRDDKADLGAVIRRVEALLAEK